VFGPPHWRSDPSYDVSAEIVNVYTWGYIFVAVGMFKLLTLYLLNHHFTDYHRREIFRFGSALGGALALMWAVAMTCALFIGKVDQWEIIPAWYAIGGVQLLSAASIWER
jgi:hypothetical protein